jgi:threonylcarbamoyladenosine tRNA methylthiotransferase MtaB
MGLAFHVENFGCRAARADGEAVSDRLRAAGLGEGQTSTADVVVVNTCSVTAEADRAARAFIRRAHRLNPEARIVVTGCYAQREPEKLAGMPGVAAVVGNSHKALAPEIALNLARDGAAGALQGVEKGVPLRSIGEEHSPEAKAHVDSFGFMRGLRPPPPSGFGFSAACKAPEGSPSPLELTSPGLVTIQSLLASSASGSAPIWADDRFAHSFIGETQLLPGAQTRPNLKIQEGCGNRCTFCVIPETRGPSRSLPAASILRQVEGFVAAGGNELVLSGINLGRWGRDLPPAGEPRLSLARLVRQIFSDTALPRLRLSSIEPMDWDGDLIALLCEFGGTRFARHAHLPLQSGSDTVLRRMHRRYRPWHYAEKVAALLEAAGPELTLGADVMVGFPGETDREFQETLELVRALPFGYLHLFPFSPRPGTPGWALHAQSPVSAAAVVERMAALRALAAEKSETHRRRFMGRAMEAITLHTPVSLEAKGRTAALTENYLPVEIEGQLPANCLVQLHIEGLTSEAILVASSGHPVRESIV